MAHTGEQEYPCLEDAFTAHQTVGAKARAAMLFLPGSVGNDFRIMQEKKGLKETLLEVC